MLIIFSAKRFDRQREVFDDLEDRLNEAVHVTVHDRPPGLTADQFNAFCQRIRKGEGNDVTLVYDRRAGDAAYGELLCRDDGRENSYEINFNRDRGKLLMEMERVIRKTSPVIRQKLEREFRASEKLG